jgi:hypothetical protein
MNMHVKRPDLAVDSIPSKLAVQHRRAEKARQRVRKLREKASAEIERLIAFMDATDGYTTTEQEEDHDAEPSLGFHKHGGGQEVGGSWHDDREAEDEHDEPSLGACEQHPSGYLTWGGDPTQERWSQGNSDERERDDADDPKGESVNEDGDGNPDDEPSLGWPEGHGMGVAGMGGWDDREAQDYLAVPAKHREATGITVECSHRRFVHGLTDSQHKTFREQMSYDSGVRVLR